MDRIKRGFYFWKEIWTIAFNDIDLLKPSFYATLAGLVVTLIGSLFIVGSTLLLGDRSMGQIVTGFFGIALIFTQLTVGYIFSAMTAYLVYGYLAEGDGRMDQAWAIVRRDWLDILSLALASTVVNLLKGSAKNRKRNPAMNMVSGIVDVIWTEATYLVLPVMVIEDLSLKNGLARVAQIVRDHLLLIGISTVGVRFINGLVGLVLGAIGVLAGAAAGFGIFHTLPYGTPAIVAGIVVGILVASLFILTAVVANSYTATAYHTCLFLWARDVERARQDGKSEAAAPAPLANALGWAQKQTDSVI